MTPRSEQFRQPGEWEPHEAVWLAWPSDEELWKRDLGPAREAFVSLCRAINEGPGERIDLLVPDAKQESAAADALSGIPVRVHRVPFGDIWLRDIAPIFVRSPSGEVAAVRFQFNGWGGKYVLPHDDEVSEAIAGLSSLRQFRCDWILEGGSVDVDGEGTCLTTRQCLLNPNRNPQLDQAGLEKGLLEALGVERVLWLGAGLANDHTDGHVDTLARFVRPGVVVCMDPWDREDPNRLVLIEVIKQLGAFEDARGRQLEVVRVPSPGRVTDAQGAVLPASYVNFYIGNATVVVPTYGSPYDAAAVEIVARLFPERKTVGISAKAILSGGGAFHCITQQQPAAGGAR
jgi:agmatine deiminase